MVHPRYRAIDSVTPEFPRLGSEQAQPRSCGHPGQARKHEKRAAEAAPENYSSFASVGLVEAIVAPASPTLKRAKRRMAMFSPSLLILVAMSCAMETAWSLMKGCSIRQTSS